MHDSDCFYPILFELTSCCLKYTFPEMYSVSLLDDSGTFRIEINEKGIFSGKLEGEEKIEIGLYDINGRLLSTLVNEFLTEGYHNQTVQLNNMNLKSGIYLVVFKSRDNLVTKKLIYN